MNWAWSPPNSRNRRQLDPEPELDSSSNWHSQRRHHATIASLVQPQAMEPSVCRPRHPSRPRHCHSSRTIIWDSRWIHWIHSTAATRTASPMSPTIGHAMMALSSPAIRPSRCKYSMSPTDSTFDTARKHDITQNGRLADLHSTR